jgi:hypothetical protein
MPDHGSANMEVSLSATQRKAVFDIPAEQGDLFGLALNDTQDNPLTGLEKIGIGTSQIPICDLGVTIRKFR